MESMAGTGGYFATWSLMSKFTIDNQPYSYNINASWRLLIVLEISRLNLHIANFTFMYIGMRTNSYVWSYGPKVVDG